MPRPHTAAPSASRKPPAATPLPHSWLFSNWPAGVAPGGESRGRYLFRVFKRELIAAGAITRIGRQVVFLGAGYARFLESRIGEVDGYEIQMNRVRRARRDRRAAAAAAV
jgi:hypothetical protein